MAYIEKRYQRYGRNGVEWTPWFKYSSSNNRVLEPWQLKSGNLKNEYREVDNNGSIKAIKVSYSSNSTSNNKTDNKTDKKK